MAKRVAKKGKPKRRKRETSAERAARETKRRHTLSAAGIVADTIEFETWARAWGRDEKDKRMGTRYSLGYTDVWEGGEKDFFILGERNYSAIGRLLCEYHDRKNPSKFLRLVADMIDGKEPYSPGDNWYDGAIFAAINEACRRFRGEDNSDKVNRNPTFSQFEKVFREQNPKLQGASDRSLRRSLKRLAIITRPDKRGRPKEK
jgi:hypothetical protein